MVKEGQSLSVKNYSQTVILSNGLFYNNHQMVAQEAKLCPLAASTSLCSPGPILTNFLAIDCC